MRRHLEGAELDQTQPSGRTIRREQLIDAEFGTMGIAGDVDQKITEQAVDQPRRRRIPFADRRHHCERNLELVELVGPRLVDARGLAGGADERPEKRYDSEGGAANRGSGS